MVDSTNITMLLQEKSFALVPVSHAQKEKKRARDLRDFERRIGNTMWAHFLLKTETYCMPQRVGQHHIISCAEPCTATKFLHLLDNVDSALEAI